MKRMFHFISGLAAASCFPRTPAAALDHDVLNRRVSSLEAVDTAYERGEGLGL